MRTPPRFKCDMCLKYKKSWTWYKDTKTGRHTCIPCAIENTVDTPPPLLNIRRRHDIEAQLIQSITQ